MTVRSTPTGSFEARFTHRGRAFTKTLLTKVAAEAWEQRTRRELKLGTFVDAPLADPDQPGKALPPTLGEYAASFVADRPLKPSTRALYRGLLQHLAPLADLRLDQLDRSAVKRWHSALDLPPTRKAHVYSLLRTILNAAVDDELIEVSPAKVKGAGSAARASRTDVPTGAEVHALAEAMPSQKYRTMVLVSAWCGLRFGESTELRRKDVMLAPDGLPLAFKVRRGVTRVEGAFIVGTPKSRAGVRDVVIPPHIRGDVAAYLDTLPNGPEALLFPGSRNGTHMAPSSLYRPFYAARARIGLPGLRWHDLRHFSATTAAQAGATLAELQARLGHSTVAAALRYQSAVSGRDAVVAEAMSAAVMPFERRA